MVDFANLRERNKFKKFHQIKFTRFLALDTETSGLDLVHGCAAFAVSTCDNEGNIHYFEVPVDPTNRKPLWTKKLIKQLEALVLSFKDGHYVFHNLIFDVKVLSKLSKVLRRFFRSFDVTRMHDTMVLAHLLDSKGPRGLKDLSVLHLDCLDDDEEDLDKTIKKLHFVAKRVGWDYARPNHPQFPGAKSKWHKMDMWLARAYAESEHFEGTKEYRDFLINVCGKYAKQDAERTAGLFNVFVGSINEDPQAVSAYRIQQRCFFPLIDMEENGIHLLPDEFDDQLAEYRDQRETFLASLRTLCDDPDLNPESGPQVKEVLYSHFGFQPEKTTKTGAPSTDKGALAGLLYQKNTLQAKRFAATLLRYRATNTAVTYLESYDRFQFNRFLHPNMNIVGTATTRLSSSEPNGQNVSKGRETEDLDEDGNKIILYSLRKVFGPPPGYDWYAIDYDQLQMRIFAFLSGEKSLMDALGRGFDFHTTVAQEIFGVDVPSKSQRRIAKNVNFGIIFGAGERKIELICGKKGIYKQFTRMYPNVASYIASTSEEVRKNGFIRTASGYPLTVPRNKAYAGVNYRVQGTEGDIVKYTLGNIYDYLQFNEPSIQIILQVHDEFLFQCPKGVEFPVKHICDLMEQAGDNFNVPCKAKPEKLPHNWGSPEAIAV
jgi:DNA polymerase I-like protein with 3'-5' exonuclease and polymerase domains